jgi:hypothetical protein
MTSPRPYEALVDLMDPAWPMVQEWLAEATVPVEVLAPDPTRARVALTELQVTTRSPMGAIVHETGGILADHGWLRLLGSGNPRLDRSLPAWTREQVGTQSGVSPPYLLIADDVIGGAFGLNGGGLPGELGAVCYFAPDTLAWENLGLGYSDFAAWCVSERLATFYQDFRWPAWEAEVRRVDGDHAIALYPFPWADGPGFGDRERRVVPIRELWRLQHQFLELGTQARDS